MRVDRSSFVGAGPTEEATELLALTHEIAVRELEPAAGEAERAAAYPRDKIRLIGASGLLGLPFPEEYGGGGRPYELYVRVVEELARAWLAVGLTVSVHTLCCLPILTRGTAAQRTRLLPSMIGGERLGGYCLSEPEAGSDPAAMTTRAVRDGAGWRIDGMKAWVTHAGEADFYLVFARTGAAGPGGISCFIVDADADGLQLQPREKKMGLRASPTAGITFAGVRVPADALIGAEGEGFAIAMGALDGGRVGVAACASGLAQAALDYAVSYAAERRQFGAPIIDFQGVGFLLADMATSVAAGRALYSVAARRRDAGAAYSRDAAMAKLFCTDTAMRVTTDAVQVLGGAGYVEDHPVERWMREAKVMQIFEGTNQIQRLVIARSIAREAAGSAGD